MLSLLREGFSQGGKTWADLKCEGKEPSMSDKLIIDVIGVIKMSIHIFRTRLVGIGSKSEDLCFKVLNWGLSTIGSGRLETIEHHP